MRLFQLVDEKLDKEILGQSRLRELYHAILKEDSGEPIIRAVGIENEIARSIEYISSNYNKSLTIDNMATQVGYISYSQFSREFKRMYGQSPKNVFLPYK